MVGNQVGLDGYREERQFVSWKDLQSMGEGEPNSKFAGRVLDHPCDSPIGYSGASVPKQPMNRHVVSS